MYGVSLWKYEYIRHLTQQQHWVDIFFGSLDIWCTRHGQYSEDESTCNVLVCSRTFRREQEDRVLFVVTELQWYGCSEARSLESLKSVGLMDVRTRRTVP